MDFLLGSQYLSSKHRNRRRSPIFEGSGPLLHAPIRSSRTEVHRVRTNPKRDRFMWHSKRRKASTTVTRRRPHLRGEIRAHSHNQIRAMTSTSTKTKGMSSRSKLYP
jgi:hypothetical protein